MKYSFRFDCSYKRKKKFYSSKLLYWNSTEFSTKEKKKTIFFSPNFLFSIPLNYETRKNQNSIFLSTEEGNLRLYYLNIFKYFKATPKTQFFTETFPIRIFFSLFSPFKIVKYSKPPIQFFTRETKSLLSSIIFLFFFFFFFFPSTLKLDSIFVATPLPNSNHQASPDRYQSIRSTSRNVRIFFWLMGEWGERRGCENSTSGRYYTRTDRRNFATYVRGKYGSCGFLSIVDSRRHLAPLDFAKRPILLFSIHQLVFSLETKNYETGFDCFYIKPFKVDFSTPPCFFFTAPKTEARINLAI